MTSLPSESQRSKVCYFLHSLSAFPFLLPILICSLDTAKKDKLEERHRDCISLQDMTTQVKELESRHQADLQKGKDEISQLKAKIEELTGQIVAEAAKRLGNTNSNPR